jgi:putative transcriptional regulator
MSKTTTTAKIRSDGVVVEVLSDGTERRFPKPSALLGAPDIAAKTLAEIEGALVADSDAPPMTPEQLRAARRVPRVKTLRQALQLTQEQFAERYGVPLGTLRDWEQGRAEPDQTSRTYLKAIAGDPEGVRLALCHAQQA